MNLFGKNAEKYSKTITKFGIIGGSGMCSFGELNKIAEIKPITKYGLPSDNISIYEYDNKHIAFLPRHGIKHNIPPHKIPYKANLAALKEIGIEYVIGTCIAGSLSDKIFPGSIVLPDQFVNLTWGRDDSYEADGQSFIHLPMGEPYCINLKYLIEKVACEINMPIISKGTVAVIQGPRFSTKAESLWLSNNGWDIVNMTQYPECYFAKELGLCYASIAAITDYDVGLQKDLTINPHNMSHILNIFNDNIVKTKKLLYAIIERYIAEFSCNCAECVLKAYYEENL